MKSYKSFALLTFACLSLPLYAADTSPANTPVVAAANADTTTATTSLQTNTNAATTNTPVENSAAATPAPEYNPETARAYEAYLLTFVWPEQDSTEQVKYKNVLTTDNLVRYQNQNTSSQDSSSSAANISQLSVPFDEFKNKIAPHATVLVNQKWTLIFKQTGDQISKTFHSDQLKDGYPELTGSIAIKLGHYLESDIKYQHYLFDSFSTPPNTAQTTPDANNALLNDGTQRSDTAVTADPNSQPQVKLFEPALVLDVEQKNKTASKKLNYIDHPILGTLLYFEPINLDDAINQISLEKLTQQAQDAQPSNAKPDQLIPTNESISQTSDNSQPAATPSSSLTVSQPPQ